jgi:hypothetical protein
MTTRFLRWLLLPLLLIAAAATLSAQTTTITLSDDTEYTGTLLRESADTVVIRTTAGIEIAVPRVAIRAIDYGAERSDWSQAFWGVGGVSGFPAGLNIVLERNFGGRFGLRASGGYLYYLGGLELDALFRFARKGSADHHLLAGAGYLHLDGDDINDSDVSLPYVHFGYLLHWGGFNMLLSLGRQLEGDDYLFLGNFQIGYVHRFR